MVSSIDLGHPMHILLLPGTSKTQCFKFVHEFNQHALLTGTKSMYVSHRLNMLVSRCEARVHSRMDAPALQVRRRMHNYPRSHSSSDQKAFVVVLSASAPCQKTKRGYLGGMGDRNMRAVSASCWYQDGLHIDDSSAGR
ncbi:uncharacterized protein STEHIDRAFT_118832 [Stereum hirsutum FP-91666 SS1]|uniref:uncharacterized protein n=1 Tax=Stereum hirsutum (strain FP-91666) TaxID=721885 RepID=UPI000440C711|nr:uncharacterized protein STEHIDRAFT_118832 [Stereum hirsutum FP-91666 SS1]EIM89706.1 hypothetical protein STEHIDRAFT_118832 [Stereum hirsutum FP-91666 SS1]